MRSDNALSKSMQYPRQQKSFSVEINQKKKKKEEGGREEERKAIRLSFVIKKFSFQSD